MDKDKAENARLRNANFLAGIATLIEIGLGKEESKCVTEVVAYLLAKPGLVVTFVEREGQPIEPDEIGEAIAPIMLDILNENLSPEQKFMLKAKLFIEMMDKKGV